MHNTPNKMHLPWWSRVDKTVAKLFRNGGGGRKTIDTPGLSDGRRCVSATKRGKIK